MKRNMLCFKTLSTHKLNKLLSNSIHKNIKSKRKRNSLDLSKCKLFANPMDVNGFVDEQYTPARFDDLSGISVNGHKSTLSALTLSYIKEGNVATGLFPIVDINFRDDYIKNSGEFIVVITFGNIPLIEKQKEDYKL